MLEKFYQMMMLEIQEKNFPIELIIGIPKSEDGAISKWMPAQTTESKGCLVIHN